MTTEEKLNHNAKVCILCAAIMIALTTLNAAVFCQLNPTAASPQTLQLEYGNVTTEQAKALIDCKPNLIIIDCRTRSEFDTGHIDGAINLPSIECADCGIAGGIELYEDILDRNSEILIYCRSGRRSAEMMTVLNLFNFEKVYNMKGGILAWQEANLPVVGSDDSCDTCP